MHKAGNPCFLSLLVCGMLMQGVSSAIQNSFTGYLSINFQHCCMHMCPDAFVQCSVLCKLHEADVEYGTVQDIDTLFTSRVAIQVYVLCTQYRR